MRQPVFPVKTQPVHIVLDRLDELGALLARIRIVETQKRPSASLGGYAEVEANGHDVPDVQIAVRLWRKSGHDFGMLTRLEVVVNDLADEIPRFAIVHGAGLYANFFKRGAIRVQLRAVLTAHENTFNMPKITLPDGSERQYDAATSGADIAESIGTGLARAAVAVRVDGDLWDLNREISADAEVAIITRDSDDGIELLRHDAAHVLAEAVKELWPDTQVTIGPAIENGFYYDFAREEPFTDADLETIEKRMRQIVERNEEIIRTEMPRDEAFDFFRNQGEEYKAEIIASIPSNEPITLYKQGEFIDLCRGPHLPSTKYLGSDTFKLMNVAGAY